MGCSCWSVTRGWDLRTLGGSVSTAWGQTSARDDDTLDILRETGVVSELAGDFSNPDRSHVSQPERREDPVVLDTSADGPGRVPLTARLLLRDSLTARSGCRDHRRVYGAGHGCRRMLERVLDHQEYPTIGRGLWFALQTVTTVGYGDVTPRQAVGRFIAAVVMLSGIGFLAVITASVTASLVESTSETIRRAVRIGRCPAARSDR